MMQHIGIVARFTGQVRILEEAVGGT